MTIYLVEQDTAGMGGSAPAPMTGAVIVATNDVMAKAAAVDACGAFGFHIEAAKLTVAAVGEYAGTLPPVRFRRTSRFGRVLAISGGE